MLDAIPSSRQTERAAVHDRFDARSPASSQRTVDQVERAAVVIERPGEVRLRGLGLRAREADEVLIEVQWSGISTGTERLLWSGAMPPFPGLSYPLVPGYESVGRVVEPAGDLQEGELVFVPGAQGHVGAASLFGASAGRVLARSERLHRIDPEWGSDAALLALAATAYHAVERCSGTPELIVGHGVLGRLLARVTIALGHPSPTVWERSATRREPADAYEVIDPKTDRRQDYRFAVDVSGDNAVMDGIVGHCARGAEIVLAGFYGAPLSLTFPPAFMREVSFAVSAEFTHSDVAAVLQLVRSGQLSLAGLVSHVAPAADAARAYATAFEDPHCLKMILDWSDAR